MTPAEATWAAALRAAVERLDDEELSKLVSGIGRENRLQGMGQGFVAGIVLTLSVVWWLL